MAYVCPYVREKVMFKVYGGESESMSDQYASFFVFSHLLSILHLSYVSFYAGLSSFILLTRWVGMPFLIQFVNVLDLHFQGQRFELNTLESSCDYIDNWQIGKTFYRA